MKPQPLEKRRQWEIVRRRDQEVLGRTVANTATEAWRWFVRDFVCGPPKRGSYDVRRVIEADAPTQQRRLPITNDETERAKSRSVARQDAASRAIRERLQYDPGPDGLKRRFS